MLSTIIPVQKWQVREGGFVVRFPWAEKIVSHLCRYYSGKCSPVLPLAPSPRWIGLLSTRILISVDDIERLGSSKMVMKGK